MLIKDYTYTIGKYLPTNQRDDIALEVETTIYEQLLSEYGKVDYTEAQIEKVIYAMGSPKSVAEAYMGKPYSIISSQLIPIYWMVVKFSILAVSIALAVTGFIELAQVNSNDYVSAFINFLSHIWEASLSSFGMITIIFILISKKVNAIEDNDKWSIKSLSKYAPEKHRIKTSHSIATIVFTILAMIWLNYFKLGIYYSVLGTVGFIQVLNLDEFNQILVFINIIWGLNIILNIYLLIKGQWELFTRCADIIISLIGLGIFSYIVFKPGIIDYSVLNNTSQLATLRTITQMTLNLSVLGVGIAVAFDTWHHIKALFFSTNEIDELNQQLKK